MTALRWATNYWYIPVMAILAVLAWVFLRRRPPVQAIQDELAVVRAGVQAQKEQAEVGAAEAAKLVRARYKAVEEKLDAEQRAQVVELESDPVALARLLERVSR